MKEVICINSLFSSDVLEFYKEHGVSTPDRDKIYNVRDVIINSTGETGILLEEIVNPKVPVKHPLFGIASIEPNWHINRFRALDGTELTLSELRETTKQLA